jgi:hypothetical protein
MNKMCRAMCVALCVLLPGSAGVTAEKRMTEENSWAFAQPTDAFTGEALVDLRFLNEEKSGQSGFIRLSGDGNDFVRGDGQPIRFWIVGSNGHLFAQEEMDRHTRWLAKIGVNMARLHVTVCNHTEGAAITDLNEQLIDGVYRFIKSAKDQGIYVIISPYYAHFAAPESWGIEGGKVRMEGLLFIDPKVQTAYRHWTKELYTRVNPHTGLAIKDDPTVALIQIHNEDSLLFWTSQSLTDPHRKMLARSFSAWLTKQYGSVQMAWDAWGQGFKGKDALDDLAAGQLACLPIFELTQDGKDAYARRLDDTARFMAEFQYEFYAGMKRYLREELGCRQLLNATNWRTANDPKLKALERYSYHALDVDAENEYVGSDYQHVGENAAFRVNPGHFLVNESVLGKPLEMCTSWRQEEGHPFLLTETAWKNPNRYQSEGPFLVAAYQSISGVDGVAWFACTSPQYEQDPLKKFWPQGDQYCTHKWNHCYPAMMAGFPANALLYRQGYLKRPQTVVRDVRTLEDVFARKPARIQDNETYGDQRQKPELEPGWKPTGDEINPVAFLVGPVFSNLGKDDTSTSVVMDLSSFFDPAAGIIRSASHELVWDYRREICTMDAPQAQGVTGFLKRAGGRFPLSAVTITSENDYATVNIVSLDGEPIATSKKVLVQVVTENRLTGFETKDAKFLVGKGANAYEVDGEEIVRIGKPPFRITNSLVNLEVKNDGLKEAVVLDINGYPVKTIPIERGKIELPKDAIYVVLRAG